MDQGLPSVKVYTLLYAVFQHGDTVDKKLQLFQLWSVPPTTQIVTEALVDVCTRTLIYLNSRTIFVTIPFTDKINTILNEDLKLDNLFKETQNI